MAVQLALFAVTAGLAGFMVGIAIETQLTIEWVLAVVAIGITVLHARETCNDMEYRIALTTRHR